MALAVPERAPLCGVRARQQLMATQYAEISDSVAMLVQVFTECRWAPRQVSTAHDASPSRSACQNHALCAFLCFRSDVLLLMQIYRCAVAGVLACANFAITAKRKRDNTPFHWLKPRASIFRFVKIVRDFSVKLRSFCFTLTFYSRSQMLGANVSAKGQNTVHQCSCSDLLRSRTHVRFLYVVIPVDYIDHTGTTATYARSAR